MKHNIYFIIWLYVSFTCVILTNLILLILCAVYSPVTETTKHAEIKADVFLETASNADHMTLTTTLCLVL